MDVLDAFEAPQQVVQTSVQDSTFFGLVEHAAELGRVLSGPEGTLRISLPEPWRERVRGPTGGYWEYEHPRPDGGVYVVGLKTGTQRGEWHAYIDGYRKPSREGVRVDVREVAIGIGMPLGRMTLVAVLIVGALYAASKVGG